MTDFSPPPSKHEPRAWREYLDTTDFAKRNLAIIDDYKAGATLGELNQKYGITKQRIGQIINNI